jgi:hypothetical protein
MFTIIVIIVFLVVPICVWLFGRVSKIKFSRTVSNSIFVSIVASLIVMAGCIPVYMQKLTERATLEAVYYNNIQNYQSTITDTTAYLSEDEFVNQLIAGSVEKINLGEQIAQRISEWRDSVNAYNIQFNTYKAMAGNIFTGVLYPKLPNELKMLTISTNSSE